MRLKTFRIRNFRCCKSMEIDIGSMHAIVGANGAGKSTILKALDLFFNPSTRRINDESFYQKDMTQRIEIEGLFVELTAAEKAADKLGPYLRPDGSFHCMRTVTFVPEEGRSDDEEAAPDATFRIVAHYLSASPKYDWLNAAKIKTETITEWWKQKEKLVCNGVSFVECLGGSRPSVGTWKTKAEEFAKAHLRDGDFQDEWLPNPKGYSGVLKGTLPHFELIPAVRDASEESKVTKSSPFGRLIYQIVETLDASLRSQVEQTLKSSTYRLNRIGGEERAGKVTEVEDTIKRFLSEMMPADLELEFQHPTVELLMTTPKIWINDGFKGGVDGKGHGLQRAVIFAILRAYGLLLAQRSEVGKKTLILGIEEPELYMHPTAQRTIRRVLRAIADEGDQVLFTTHSALMVDVSYFDEIVRIESPVLDDNGDVIPGSTSRKFQLTAQLLVDDLIARHPSAMRSVTVGSIREKYGHAYSPSRNEGFFAKKIILVEGATEVYSLPIYATAIGYDLDSLGIAVVECGGKFDMDRLYRVFNELGIPCYPVFDYDKTGDAENRKATEQLFALVGEAENTAPATPLVTDAFACFADKWESDLRAEIADYDTLAEEARLFFGLSRGSGKPLIARYIAQKLAETGSSGVPPTIEKILIKAVAAHYRGTCLSQSEMHSDCAVSGCSDAGSSA